MDGQKRVIALGFFDGVHLGHGALLRRTVEQAALGNAVSTVFTFDRPPKEFVTGIPCPLINSPQDRADLVRRLYGIEEVIIAPFNRDMMTTPWETFVAELLVERFHAVHLIAGHDHRFGYRNQGTAALLRDWCTHSGMGCDIIPEVELDGVTVRSTHIRELLRAGDIEQANRFLGHPHVLTQEVRHGRQIGRTMGVPTVNLTIPPRVISLPFGVYATRVTLPDGACYTGVTNIGDRPTVRNGSDVTVETWLPDFHGDLYGQQIRVEFYTRIRGEIRFESLDALREQITVDAQTVQNWFTQHPDPLTGSTQYPVPSSGSTQYPDPLPEFTQHSPDA